MTCGQIVRFWPRVSGVPLKQRNETLQAGLRKSPAESKRLLLDYLLARPPDEQVHVLPGEVDAGRRVVEVKYRRGVRPEGYEDQVFVHAPKKTTQAAHLWVQLLVDHDIEKLILECLDPAFATKEFLTLIDPRSFMDLAEASLALTLGIGWRARFPRFANRLQENEKARTSEKNREEQH